MKKSRKALLTSALSLLLCFTMLLGTTFAWFTDSVTSTNNIIKSGKLDVEMSWSDTKDGTFKDASAGAIFDYEYWEPGFTQIKYVKIDNVGNLAFRYVLNIIPNTMPAAGEANLADVIDVYLVDTSKGDITRETLAGLTPVDTLSALMANSNGAAHGIMLPESTEANVTLNAADKDIAETGSATYCIALKMQESAGNEYQDKTVGGGFSVQLLATQYTYENDSFGNDYDNGAAFPMVNGSFMASASIADAVENNELTESVNIATDGDAMNAVVPEGVAVEEGATELTLTVEATARSGNITMNDGQVSQSLDVHIAGISENNDVPMVVNLGVVLPVGLNPANVELYHVEDDVPALMVGVSEFTDHNQYIYNSETGELSIYVKSFSEITMLVYPNNPWDGTADTNWYSGEGTEFTITTAEQLAGLGQLVAAGNSFEGITIKLGNNLSLGSEQGKVFLPIGYDEDKTDALGAFKGAFDGQGYVIRDLYQSTWSIKGNYDGSYYNESMGLFGLIEGGTVKNLILHNFEMEGEFAPMGCVTGRANGGTFEDIRLIDCHPATYNTGVAGIVGWDVSEGAAYTFTGITIDPTTTISALWGTYDAACGGIMGFLDQASSATFTDCSIGCVLDTYNDVCGNYQYYQYRYSGMLIGTIGRDTSADTSVITCKDVNVYYDDWVHYFYCEFVKNTQASYTHDYQFSRVPHSELVFTDSNGNGRIDTLEEAESVTGCTHDHTSVGTETVDGVDVLIEDKQAVYLPFNQLVSGYGWGANHETEIDGVTLEDYLYSVTYMDGTDVLLVEYVTDNTKTYTLLDAAETDKTFERWVNAGGTVISAIAAGNVQNYTLYADWENEYVARFVDQNGNLVAEVPFDADTGSLLENEPAVPAVDGGFTGAWEAYDLTNTDSDITVKPVYNHENGIISLTPVDSDNDGVTNYYSVTNVVESDANVNIVIPESLNGIPVQDISGGAFAEFDNITTVTIPTSVKNIGADAFANYENYGTKFEQITFIFEGTKAQWDAIKKDADWDQYIGTGSIIKCTDGYYILDGWIAANYKKAEWEWHPHTYGTDCVSGCP